LPPDCAEPEGIIGRFLVSEDGGFVTGQTITSMAARIITDLRSGSGERAAADHRRGVQDHRSGEMG
jgi:hypothetical protein